MKRYNFYLPESLIVALRKHAEDTGLTMSELMRRALSNYVKTLKTEHER
jgi:hypothetical protein